MSKPSLSTIFKAVYRSFPLSETTGTSMFGSNGTQLANSSILSSKSSTVLSILMAHYLLHHHLPLDHIGYLRPPPDIREGLANIVDDSREGPLKSLLLAPAHLLLLGYGSFMLYTMSHLISSAYITFLMLQISHLMGLKTMRSTGWKWD